MTLTRDLAWQNLDLIYRSSISHQFARYAIDLNYDLLPAEVVHQAKRSLLDALGCAIGAYHAPGRIICEAFAEEAGGPEEATVFCSGMRTSALSAALVNSFLVRFLDYNDFGGGGHNSDSIPGIIAVCEREAATGRDLLTAIVISYELGSRAAPSSSWPSLMARGWTTDTRGGLSMPPALGKIMGLTAEQIANAIGICASHSLPLNILDANREEYVMAKNLRFGWVVYDAIISCLLARRGFTGPPRIVEGDAGFNQVIYNGEMDMERMVDFSGWRILQTRHKSLCANGTTQGHVYATLAIVRENDLKPEDIASVHIRCGFREAHHTTAFPMKKYPRNAETADHSAFYANAIAIKERDFGPDAFDPEKFTDPVVLELIEKITVETDPALPEHSYEGFAEITTKDGRRFQRHVATPHGLGNDPLSDDELAAKFQKMAVKYMGAKQIQQIFDTVWNMEKITVVGELTKLMIFPSR